MIRKLFLSALVLCASSAFAQTYHLTDLGVSSQNSWAYAINASGQVTGFANNHVALWTNGTAASYIDLGSGFPNDGAEGVGINSLGQVIGHESTDYNSTGLYGASFIYSSNSPFQIPQIVGGNVTFCYGINDLGQVVGYANGGQNSIPYENGVLYSNGTAQFLLGLGGFSIAQAINNTSVIVGTSLLSDYTTWHACVFNVGGTATDLGTLGGTASAAQAISSNGTIVGFSNTAGDIAQHACVFSGGSVTDLGTLYGGNSVAQAINSHGQIVGYSDALGNQSPFVQYFSASFANPGQQDGSAFVYANGVMKDLNSLVDSSGVGYVITSATGINDKGQIVGTAFVNYCRHAVILTPVNTTPPVSVASFNGKAGLNGYYASAVTVTLKATDAADMPAGSGSAVAATYYSVDGGPLTTYSIPFQIASDGTHTITFHSVDTSGNVESTESTTLLIDSTPPTITATANHSVLNHQDCDDKLIPVKISGKISDLGSGVNLSSGLYSTVDNYGKLQPSGAFNIQSDGTYIFVLKLSATSERDGEPKRTYTVTVSAKDNAGNIGRTTVTIMVKQEGEDGGWGGDE